MASESVNAPSAASELAHVPKEWPGAFGLFKHSSKVVGFNLLPYLVVLIGSQIITVIVQFALAWDAEPTELTIADPINWFISLVASIATVQIILHAIDYKKITIGESINKSWKYLVRIFLLGVLTGLILFGSFILLIVPFFIVLPRIALAMYYMIDRDLGVRASLRVSWNESRGYAGKFYGIVGVNILMILPIMTIIGIPLSIYLLIAYAAALPILYRFITANQTQTAQTKAVAK